MWARRAQPSAKKQLSDEFLNGFSVCEETSKDEQTETYAHAVWWSFFASRSMMLKKMENKVGEMGICFT